MFIEKEETHYETLLCFGAVVILTAFLFRKALQFGFVSFDDALHTYRNAKLTGLSWTSVLELWKAPFQNLFIPVTYSMWATIALIASRVGQPLESSASLFHLANWLLHALNAGTVCLILLRLEKNRQAAVVGALFFAFHPLQVEPVAWISALKDTLSVFFSLVLIFFWCAPEAEGGRRHLKFCFFLYCLALFSKPGVVVLPVILFIIDYFMLKRPVPKFWMLLSLVLSFVIMAVTKNAQPDSAVASGIIVWYQRPFIILDSLSFYFTKLLFPLGLTSLYGRTPAVALGSHAAFYFIWVLFTFFYLLRRQRWTRTVGIAFLLAGVALLPTSGVIPFLFQKYSTVADRFAYLALFGVAWGVANLYAKYPRIRFATLVIISALSYISQKQLKAWEGDTTVLGHMAKVAPTADHRYNLAMLLSSQLIGKNLIPGLAIRQLPPPKNEEQARVWMKVIELNFREAVRLRPHFPEAWYGLSGVLVQEGKIAPAIAAANTAIEQDPDSEQAWQRLSLLWEWGGRKDLANAVWERWVERLAVKRTLG